MDVEKIDTRSRSQVQRFIHLPFRIYRACPEWVPPLLVDHEMQLNRNKHPFFEHSDADFFIATNNGKDVGRVAALVNHRYNEYHGTRKAQFFFFESEDDPAVAAALFECVFMWARERGLDTVIGPKGLGPLDGFGVLIDGFQAHQMMTMMNYNPSYYPRLIEQLGFIKEVDFVSCYASADAFRVPDLVRRAAERVQRRGTLRFQSFRDTKSLKAWAARIGHAYNEAFRENWEYYPLTKREIAHVVSSLETIANPELIKIVLHEDEIVGFLFAFPDLSAALQRSHGRLFPFGLIDLLLEKKRTRWVAINTAGILPEFHGLGGNALLYSEMERAIRRCNFEHAAVYQVAETATDMIRDLAHLGVTPHKRHRVYTRSI